MTDAFWAAIAAQLEELRTAQTADDVVRILASPGCVGDGFFGGSGGDDSVEDALSAAGWHHTWRNAHYYWVMRAPNGDKITYVEGDIFKGDQKIVG